MKRILVLVLGLLLLVGSAGAVTISYSSQYPPVQNSTYVLATSQGDANFYPYYATDPARALWGSIATNGWQSIYDSNNSQRFHIDLGSQKLITSIYYENYAHFGGETDRGVKNFTVWGSNTSGSFNNLTYSNDTGWTEIPASSSSFNQHIGSDAPDPQYIYLTNSNIYRYYALKIADNYGDPQYVGFRQIQLQEPIKWEYGTIGTYYWVCPNGITEITMSIVGGGGSGAAGWTSGGSYFPGTGGQAGGHQTFSSLSVTPGTNYTIVIGSPGSIVYYGNNGNNGTQSSAFGYSYPGGLRGIKTTTGSSGGDGEAGFFSSTQFAVNGSSQYPYINGLAGNGYGAGGGGGSTDPVDQNTVGGAGAQGYVSITKYGYTTGNIPNFVADRNSGGPSTVIHFTDTSTITDSTGLSYNWSFGDGSYSDTPGDVLHVYSYSGDYTVSLTITASSGVATETKTSYIVISAQPSYILPTQPKSVRFKIVDAYGSDLPGSLVTVNYISSSLPNTSVSWLTSAFGVSSEVASEMTNSGVAMQGTTGSDGTLSFIMYPVLQYGITITNSTSGLTKYITLYPQDTDYIIYCPLTSQAASTDRTTHLANSTLYVTEPNSSFITWNIIYSDTSGYTTDVTWNITCWNNMTEMYSKTWHTVGTSVLIDNYTFPSTPVGVEYRALYDATRDVP
jgi:PKD repeat protein